MQNNQKEEKTNEEIQNEAKKIREELRLTSKIAAVMSMLPDELLIKLFRTKKPADNEDQCKKAADRWVEEDLTKRPGGTE